MLRPDISTKIQGDFLSELQSMLPSWHRSILIMSQLIFGTSGSSVAFATNVSEAKIYILSDWSKNVRQTGVSVKVPTIVLLDPAQNLEAEIYAWTRPVFDRLVLFIQCILVWLR